MKNLLDDNIQYHLPKYEIILVWIGVFLNFFFYGMLNISYTLNLPYSMISGSIRLLVLLIAIFLIIIDISRSDFPKFTISIFTCFTFLLLYTIVFIYDDKTFGFYHSKIKDAYNIYIAQLSTFLIFFCGRNRFKYIISTPELVFIPSLITVSAILLIYRENLAILTFENNELNIPRTSIKYPMQYLIALSPYMMFFSKKIIYKYILGPMGCILAILNLLMSDARSAFFAFAIILIIYIVASLKNPFSFTYAATSYTICLFIFAPYFFLSKIHERLLKILEFKERINAGSMGFERYDMILEALHTFYDSPIFGGRIFYDQGNYCHFTPVAVLHSTGIIGASLFIITITGAIKGMTAIIRNLKTRCCWIIGVFIADTTFMCFDGDVKDFFCASIALFLIANAIQTEKRFF